MSKIGLIISREFNVRVKKRGFIIMTLLMPLLMVLLVVAPIFIAMYSEGDKKQKEIVVVDSSGEIAQKIKNFDEVTFISSQTKYPEVASEYPQAYAYLVIGSKVFENPNAVQLYSTQNTTMGLQNSINSQISEIITKDRIRRTNIEGLEEMISEVIATSKLSTYTIEIDPHTNQVEQKVSSSAVAIGAGYLSGFIIYMFILTYGMMVLQGVVEEKSSRVVEVIVSSVRPFELMMGKILGIAFVAILQFMIWAIIAGILLLVVLPMFGAGGGSVASTGSIGGGLPAEVTSIISVLSDPIYVLRIVGGFLVFFVGGYLLYASMYAAVGSAVDNVTDTQQLQLPVTVPLIVAIFIMMSVMNDPYSGLAFWSSMVPFTSPIVMMVRVAYGVSWWEFFLSVVLLYGSFVVMTYFASRIYRTGIFMYGKRPSFLDFLRWVRR